MSPLNVPLKCPLNVRAGGISLQRHFKGTERLIQRLIDELGLRRLSDIRAEAIERWLAQQAKPQADKPAMAARTRNSYLVAMRSFCNWCVQRDRLPFNPLTKLDRADERSDRRRQRRALTEVELNRLLIVARLRPLAEYGRETITKRSHAGETKPCDLDVQAVDVRWTSCGD